MTVSSAHCSYSQDRQDHTKANVSTHIGSEEVDIQLDEINFVKGNLPDNKNILTLFDSGATKTIISGNFVKSSRYLSRLPKTKCSPIRFRLGNGQFMTAASVIKFEMPMQGHKFQISALIVDNLVGVDLILGTNTLAELDGTLNFKEHTFKIKPQKI